MAELSLIPENLPLPWLEELPLDVRELFERSESNNTMRAYRADLVDYLEWCHKEKQNPLPCDPVQLVRYLKDRSDTCAISTVMRRASAVSWIHRRAGYLGKENPRTAGIVKEGIRLLRKAHRDQRPKQAKELTPAIVREVMKECLEDKNAIRGKRDKALILIGFASSMRRSELTQVKVEHLNFVEQGLEIYVPWSKTDQVGDGHIKRIARGTSLLTCPIEALKEWLMATGIEEGLVFRRVRKNGTYQEPLGDWAVWHVIKTRLKDLGLKNWNDFSGHSMRAGFASTSAENGASFQSIKTQGNWKSDQSFMRYIRNKENWDNPASAKLGL